MGNKCDQKSSAFNILTCLTLINGTGSFEHTANVNKVPVMCCSTPPPPAPPSAGTAAAPVPAVSRLTPLPPVSALCACCSAALSNGLLPLGYFGFLHPVSSDTRGPRLPPHPPRSEMWAVFVPLTGAGLWSGDAYGRSCLFRAAVMMLLCGAQPALCGRWRRWGGGGGSGPGPEGGTGWFQDRPVRGCWECGDERESNTAPCSVSLA